MDALVWFHAATPAAREALPPQLKARAGLPLTIGGLISYREGPVGPYGEVFGAPVLLRGRPLLTHVSFLGVDSEASIAAGRANWALPKVRAVFDGEPGLPGLVSARGDGWELHSAERWELHVRATARTRRLPFYMAARCVQVWPDGEVRQLSMRMHGRASLARVDVQHGRSSSIDWLSRGRHAAVLISGVQDIFAPAPPLTDHTFARSNAPSSSYRVKGEPLAAQDRRRADPPARRSHTRPADLRGARSEGWLAVAHSRAPTS